jgi:signal transduction histidine kinase
MNQLKNKLFSIVSHDFRSPLKSLQGTLTLLHKGAVSPEELKDLSGGLLNKVENTATFLENILNWAKSQMQGIKLKPQIINISRITNELIKLIKPQADKKFIVLNNNVEEEINVVADLEMIKLVLRNLISNALKFSYDQGQVEINAEVLNETAIISVSDHGTGIEEDQLKNIFMLENYSTEGTANETGAGLGLILCKDFVEQNNGEIWVTSKVDQGSTFSFSLPIVENLPEPELINEA